MSSSLRYVAVYRGAPTTFSSVYIEENSRDTIIAAVRSWTGPNPDEPWNSGDILYLVQDGRILWEIPVPEEILKELYGKS